MKHTIVSIIIAVILVAGYYIGKSYFLKPNLVRGEKAAEISGILADGSSFNLSSLKGKYVLLDFWGSWCKPCRESNPMLVQLYSEFHNQSFHEASGFEIVSIGVERSREAWLRAIQVDQLQWPYQLLSTTLFESPIVKAFNVKQIPTKFLINPGGIIIAVDPSIEEIKEILDDRLIRTKAR